MTAVKLVSEKEGHVSVDLLRRHFYPNHGRRASEKRLKGMLEGNILKREISGYLNLSEPVNGNGSGHAQPAVLLPPVRLTTKAPAIDNQPYVEMRLLVSLAIERLEEFQERCQPLLAALLDLERDMEAFEKLGSILAGVKEVTVSGLREIRRDLHHGAE